MKLPSSLLTAKNSSPFRDRIWCDTLRDGSGITRRPSTATVSEPRSEDAGADAGADADTDSDTATSPLDVEIGKEEQVRIV